MFGIGVEGAALVGTITAETSSFKGMSPEYWAERLMKRLFYIGEEVPPALKDQMEAFRDRMHQACLHYMRNMEKSARTTLLNELGLTEK